MTRFADSQLDSLQSKINSLERVLEAIESTLPKPLLYHSGQEHYGYRYGNPDARHFCLLKGVKAVSGLNACILLARHGFAQEIGVLIRGIVECCAQIEFVLPETPGREKVRPEARDFLQRFFADYKRNTSRDTIKLKVQQKQVHETIGGDLDRFAALHPDAILAGRVPAAERYQNVYATFSNYVHARYPEVMDMYGGEPGHFHMCGMMDTPKDAENFTILEAFIETVSLTLKLFVQRLQLKFVIETDQRLSEWYEL